MCERAAGSWIWKVGQGKACAPSKHLQAARRLPASRCGFLLSSQYETRAFSSLSSLFIPSLHYFLSRPATEMASSVTSEARSLDHEMSNPTSNFTSHSRRAPETRLLNAPTVEVSPFSPRLAQIGSSLFRSKWHGRKAVWQSRSRGGASALVM